jgi:TRAP-type C4-dicarboxylate transport system substrate-binding protein
MQRTIWRSITVASLLTVAVPGLGAAQGDSPVTLRLAVADDPGAPSDPYIRAFVDAVSGISEGSITIEPLWGAGKDAYEQGVAEQLVEGEFELGLAASRAWDHAGITSLNALQAPFLIDNDALALAVADSDVATSMLEGMASGGATGLTLWPEDLRHPVAFEGCITPLVHPADFAGLTIRAIESAVTTDLLAALGAGHVNSPDWKLGVESCEIQGAESGLTQGYSLPGTPTFTGDVTFYPKFQVLAVNNAAFERLTDAQRSLIGQASDAVRDQAIAEHRSDAGSAREWCDAGGRVVLAGAEAITAFTTAAQPVYDRIADNPASAAAIDRIRTLKAATEASPGASACEPGPRPSQPAPSAGVALSEVPEGVWRIEVTGERLTAAGLSNGLIEELIGNYTWTFASDAGSDGDTFEFRGDDNPRWGSLACSGTFTLQPSGALRVLFTSGNLCGPGHWMEWIWTTAPDGVTAEVAVVQADPVDTAMWESALFFRVD